MKLSFQIQFQNMKSKSQDFSCIVKDLQCLSNNKYLEYNKLR